MKTSSYYHIEAIAFQTMLWVAMHFSPTQMGIQQKVYPHRVYRLITYALGRFMTYQMGEGPTWCTMQKNRCLEPHKMKR